MSKCYMCDNDAVSVEHVPPLCLFPEMKDTGEINFRKNLITVPSCDLHNSKKSDDDEFLMLSLSGLMKNNPVGQFHQLIKGNRAIKRKNKKFIEKQILRNHRLQKIKTPDNNFRMISVGNPNFERLSDSFRHIAYGMYFHEFKKRFEGKIDMLFEFLEYTDDNIQTLKTFLKKRFLVENKLNKEIQGDNPAVFYYQFHEPDEFGLIALKMVFYGTAEVYLSFASTDSKEPFDLTWKFIESGINTTLNLGDENFIFNKYSTTNTSK